MKQAQDFMAKPAVERRRAYARGAAVLAAAAILFALYAQYVAQRTLKKLHVKDVRVSEMQHLLDSTASDAKLYKNAYEETYADNIALEAQNDKTLAALSDAVFGLKDNQERLVTRVSYLTKVAQTARVDSVFIRYDTTGKIPVNANGRSDSIGVPQRFRFADDSKTVAGSILKTGVLIDSLSIPDSLYLRGGVRKHGFLNLQRETFVQAIHTSPYIQTSGLSEIRVKQRAKRWGIGPHVGVGWRGGKDFYPNVGFGVQYNVVRF